MKFILCGIFSIYFMNGMFVCCSRKEGSNGTHEGTVGRSTVKKDECENQRIPLVDRPGNNSGIIDRSGTW